jgi:hypothetical protein
MVATYVDRLLKQGGEKLSDEQVREIDVGHVCCDSVRAIRGIRSTQLFAAPKDIFLSVHPNTCFLAICVPVHFLPPRPVLLLQVEEALERVVQLFSYIADKDVFGEIYRGQVRAR